MFRVLYRLQQMLKVSSLFVNASKNHYQKCCVGKCIVMMQNPLVRSFLKLKVEYLIDCLFWRNKFIMDNSFDIKNHISRIFKFIFFYVLESSIGDFSNLFQGHTEKPKSLHCSLFFPGQVFPTIFLEGLSKFLIFYFH
jgi:hypothetical protein